MTAKTLKGTGSIMEQLITFLRRTSFDALPPEVVHEGKRLTLDMIGNAIGGYDSDIGKITARYASRLGGNPRATIIGNGKRTSTELAAYVNHRTADALDSTDTFTTWAHLGPTAVFPALALEEESRGTGKDFLAASILGLEVGMRLASGLGVSIPNPHPKPGESTVKLSHIPRLFPYITATAASVKALGLDADKTVNAFGLTGAIAGAGFPRFFDVYKTMPLMKYMDVGRFSQQGIYSALLASEGMTAYPINMDGDDALWKIAGGTVFDQEIVVREIGKRWCILSNSYKPWTSCRFTQHALTAFRKMLEKNDIKPKDIERVIVKTHPWAQGAAFKNKEPVGMAACEFNIPHTIAMMALNITRGPKWYSPETMNDDMVMNLRRRVDVELEETCTNPQQWFVDHHPTKLPTRVIVHTKDRIYESYIEYAGGDPQSPETIMNDSDLLAKFKDLVSQRGDNSSKWDRKIENMAQSVYELDKIEDISIWVHRISRIFATGAEY